LGRSSEKEGRPIFLKDEVRSKKSERRKGRRAKSEERKKKRAKKCGMRNKKNCRMGIDEWGLKKCGTRNAERAIQEVRFDKSTGSRYAGSVPFTERRIQK
jgi:hypothetical protein